MCIFQLFTGFGGSLGFTILVPPPRPIAFFCFSKCFFSFFSARTWTKTSLRKNSTRLSDSTWSYSYHHHRKTNYLLLIFQESGEDILIILPGCRLRDHRSRGHWNSSRSLPEHHHMFDIILQDPQHLQEHFGPAGLADSSQMQAWMLVSPYHLGQTFLNPVSNLKQIRLYELEFYGHQVAIGRVWTIDIMSCSR